VRTILILRNGLALFFEIYYYILLGRIILNWFQASFHGNPTLQGIYRVLFALTEPLLAPLRRMIPPVRMGMGYLDLSPLILLFLLYFLRILIFRHIF
jgi:YggT family protein